MANLQQVHVLAAPDNYPGVAPTSASPSPVFGLPSAHIQGLSVYSNSANPTGNSQVNIDYFVLNQKYTGTLICSETVAAIITAANA